VLAIAVEALEPVFGFLDRPVTAHGCGDITQFDADLPVGPCTGGWGMLMISPRRAVLVLGWR
jgi:hypothetical protein